jgi:hypothetical protein
MLSLFTSNEKNLKLDVHIKQLCKFWFAYFEQTLSTSEPTTKLVSRKLLIFQMLPKKSNVFFNGEGNLKLCFLLLIFLPIIF